MLDLKGLITHMGAAGRFQGLTEIKDFLMEEKFNSCLAEERDSDETIAYIDKIIKVNKQAILKRW